MKNDFEQVKAEITGTVASVRDADAHAAQHEQEIRREYEAEQAKMNAALESGNLEQYKVAGMAAQEKKLELEFIERSRERGRKPAAGTDDDNRIRAAISAEYRRVYVDAMAQLRKIFDEAASVADEALRSFDLLDSLYSTWENVVMRQEGKQTVVSSDSRLSLQQLEHNAKAQIVKIQYMEGK